MLRGIAHSESYYREDLIEEDNVSGLLTQKVNQPFMPVRPSSAGPKAHHDACRAAHEVIEKKSHPW